MRDNPGILTRVSVAPDVYFSPATEQGCIVLNVERGNVLSLNGIGALMFSKLAEAKDGLTRAEFVETVSREFADVESSRIQSAVDDLLARLTETETIRTAQHVAAIAHRDVGGEIALRLPFVIRHLLRPLLYAKSYTLATLVLLFTAEAVRRLGGFRSIHHAVERWEITLPSQVDDTTLANAC